MILLMRRFSLVLLSIYLFVYPWSLPLLMFGLVPDWGAWMGGFLVTVQGSLIALWMVERYRWRGALAAAAIALLSFAVEYTGVTTGVPFGRYIYTDVLGIKLGAVPLPIPFAWLIAVPGALAVGQLLGVRGWWRVPIAALLAVIFDIAIEPFAAHIAGYWQWLDSGPYYAVPTANFVAWGTTALVLAAITFALCRQQMTAHVPRIELPAVLFVLNLAQFLCVDLAYGYWGAAVLGLPLVLVCVWRMLALATARNWHWRMIWQAYD